MQDFTTFSQHECLTNIFHKSRMTYDFALQVPITGIQGLLKQDFQHHNFGRSKAGNKIKWERAGKVR
jgi:hypothetical protein